MASIPEERVAVEQLTGPASPRTSLSHPRPPEGLAVTSTPMNGRPRLLSAAQEGAFEWHARRLGHEPGRLRGDTEQVSYPVLASVAALRAVPAATPEQRRRRQAVFFGPAITIRRAIGQGVHDRVEAAVFADGQIGAEDEARAARHFPFPTRILSVRHRVVPAGTCWDLSVRGEYWRLDDRDDILNVVCVGSLCLEPGAIVVVRGNLLILIVQRVICEDASCQVAILPTPFPVDPATGPLHGAAGLAGRDGAAGGAGVAAGTADGAVMAAPARLASGLCTGSCRQGATVTAGMAATAGTAATPETAASRPTCSCRCRRGRPACCTCGAIPRPTGAGASAGPAALPAPPGRTAPRAPLAATGGPGRPRRCS